MNTRRQSAFTLIELLVVIAIIALLISILLPSLSSARGLARQLAGAAIHKNLGAGQHMYMNNFKDQYAGRNTSGGYWSAVWPGQTPPVGWLQLEGDTDAVRPTSTEDWISPIIGDSMNFSPNRARRTQQIFRNLRDPAARVMNDTLYGSAGDRNDFQAALVDGGFYQVSFLTPSSFHYLSNLWHNVPVQSGHPAFNSTAKMDDEHGNPAVSPKDFSPRLDRVGTQLSQKILIMDGTRYLGAQGLDFDMSTNPGIYGSFSENPAYYGSTAYGRDPASGGGNGGNGWKLSARHPNHTLNATFFDGHTSLMKIEELWREPKYVYPSGSIWNGGDGNPEAIAKYPNGTIID